MIVNINIEGSRTGSNLVQIKGQHSICPGDIAVYRCTVCGAGATVWRGSLFDCIGDEIILRHSQFLNKLAVGGVCNNGAVVAQSIGVDVDTNSERECFSSQLNISTNMDMNNKTVVCLHDDATGNGTSIINTSTIIFITGSYLCMHACTFSSIIIIVIILCAHNNSLLLIQLLIQNLSISVMLVLRILH